MTSISKKYFISRFSLKVAVNFLVDIYHSNKIMELMSFIIWEIKYQLCFYKKSDFVKFIDDKPLQFLSSINTVSITSHLFLILKCKYNWQLMSLSSDNVVFGCTYNEPSLLLYFAADETPIKCFEFGHKIENIFIDKSDNIFICSGGVLFKSNKKDLNFIPVLNFSSFTSYFRPESITENLKGEIFIGEYANNKNGKKWKFAGFIYHSTNNGDTWTKIDFLKKQGINKHIHILKWSNQIQALILTDGDNKKGLWVNKSRNQFDKISKISENGWRKVNRFHIHKGGYTAITEINNQIIFGTDYYGGSNFLVYTKDLKVFHSKLMPDPYRRAMISRMVVRLDENGNKEIWANLYFRHSKKVKSLLMLSTDNGNTWQKVIEYDATHYEIDIISHSANFKEKLYIQIKDKTNNLATTFCVCNFNECRINKHLELANSAKSYNM